MASSYLTAADSVEESVGTMGRCEANFVSPAQIEAARSIGTLEYLQRYEPEELTNTYSMKEKTMRCRPSEYRTRTHDSLSVNGNWFYWWSRGEGGRSALDYLVKVKEMPFQDAVRFLTADAPVLAMPAQTAPSAPKPPPPEEKKNLVLPPENENHRRVFAYLSRSRGIDPEIINHCLKHKLLYEDNAHHNAVFVGYEAGKPLFGSLRSTITDSHWRMDLPGSDKRFSFRMEHPQTSRVMVFEAPIDAMSMASLLKMQGQDWKSVSYLSLSGTAPTALLHYLQAHPDITKVTIALDNDAAGRRNAEKLRETVLAQYPDKKVNVVCPSQAQGKDWNDVLLCKRQQEQPQSLQARLNHARRQTSQENQHHAPASYQAKRQER